MRKNARVTSLWNIVESMQRALENLGLEAHFVDATVTCRVESLLVSMRPLRGTRPVSIGI